MPQGAKVSFAGEFRPEHVVRFREAMSALHDVVVNDQRFVPKDRVNIWLGVQRKIKSYWHCIWQKVKHLGKNILRLPRFWN